MNRCPGGELRNLTVQEIACGECGATVELFSDEQKRRCPSCREWVVREAAPSCAAWCGSARQCMGEARYLEAVEKGAIPDPADTPDT